MLQRRLTKRTVDALVPNGKDTVIWDRGLKGFGLRMLASGCKVFVVQSRGPGGFKRASLGQHGKLTADQARERKVATTARYAHLVRDAEKAAAVRVGASIEAHLGGDRRETEQQE